MKSPLLVAALVCMGTAINAQITITNADFPGIGISLYQGVDTVLPVGLDVGTASATAQTWNFQALETDSIFEFTFDDPANAPHGEDFPDADVAVDQFGGSGFVDVNSSAAEFIGFSGDNFQGFAVDISAAFEDSYQLLSFPSTYLTSYTDDATLDISIFNDNLVSFPPLFEPDSLRLKRTSAITSEIDAFGTLTDALGDSHDVLRQYFVEESIDSLWFYQGGQWSMVPSIVFENPRADTTRNYRFLSAALGYVVVDISLDHNLVAEDATFLSDPSLCCTSVEEVTQAGYDLVYPNPTSGFINVKDAVSGSSFELFDVTGNRVLNATLQNTNDRVSLSGVATGLYVFKIFAPDGGVRAGRLSVVE